MRTCALLALLLVPVWASAEEAPPKADIQLRLELAKAQREIAALKVLLSLYRAVIDQPIIAPYDQQIAALERQIAQMPAPEPKK